MAWFWYALSASILWGVSYVINQYVLKQFTIIQVLFFESIFLILVFLPYLLYTDQLKDMAIKLQNWNMLKMLLAGAIIYVIAVIFILKSITASNASLAAVVEASYPIFTMLFAYLLLGEIQFSIMTLVGTSFIITGLIIINISSVK
jgi:drug/metabolite transporter (DMT)-like permease